MSKKGLISSLIVGIVLTLSLGIYTLVSVFGGNGSTPPQGPTETTVNVAFRTSDTVEQLSGYAEQDIVFTLAGEGAQNPVVLNAETGKYEALYAGEVTATVTDAKGNKKIFKIKVYNQGTGASQEDAFIIASAKHLKEFADIVNSDSAERTVPAYTTLVSDIDLGEYNWRPIGGQGNKEYTGTFDGNGYTVNNMTISVTATNYEEFLALSALPEVGTRGFLDLGLFGKVNNATIKNLNVKNATINVATDVYSVIKENIVPEGALYDAGVVRLTIGTIAGSAYNTDIIGNEEYSNISARINAYSCAAGNQAHGIGGVVGVAQLVRVNAYNVKTNITNNLELTKNSYIGGVFGMAFSSYNVGYTNNVYDAADRTVIDNVKVDFAGTLLYKNAAWVGGVVGYGQNIGIQNSTVESFKIVDNSARSHIDYTLDDYTHVAGVAGTFASYPLTGAEKDDAAVVAAFVSGMENVDVKNVDVFMLGGDVAGAVWFAGNNYDEAIGLNETMRIKNSTVNGNITANRVAGFAWQVNPGVTIEYTKTFETAVVDLDIKAVVSAGFALLNHGQIVGYRETVPVAEGSEETKVVTTKININTIGMGALIEAPITNQKVWTARNAVYAAGFVGKSETLVAVGNADFSKGVAGIANFDINFTAKESINYAGIAFKTGITGIMGITVNANFTSYNYSAQGNNISTTYMVSGGVCEASAGTALTEIKVILNVNNGVNKSLNYGATFFGGLVARYVGSEVINEEAWGLAIDNSEVSGEVYFNHSYETITIDEVNYNVFIAGGLIGAIEAKTAAGGQEYVDALAITSFAGSHVSGNTVSNLKITADFTNDTLGSQGYRTRGVGALVGVVNIALDADVIDLSTNTVTAVEIVADEDAFTYAYEGENGSQVTNILLGANKENVFGASYAWNCTIANRITNPAEVGVTYTELAE